MQQEATQQVQAYVAGRIITRLAKLGASEETNLIDAIRAQVTNIPAPDTTAPVRQTRNISIPKTVIREALANLGRSGTIRRFTYRSTTFIARTDATREELVRAMQRTFGSYTPDRKSTLPTARTLDWKDTADQLHHSETEDGCLAISSVTSSLDAETIPALNNQDWEPNPLNSKPLSPEAAQKVAYQDRIGQGPRNTKRVEHARKQAWLQTEAGAAWKRRKHAADSAKMDILLSDPIVEQPVVLPETDDDVFSIAMD